MLLIADSGSTKTSWCFSAPNTHPEYLSTSGINPFFRSSDDIYRELKAEFIPFLNKNIEKVFFYGAGIVDAERGNVIKSALLKIFPNAEVETQSDLLAAARATLQDKPGIACILGTGSNSCLFDGEKIVSHVPPLGYVIGDEGSGNAMGRKLVADYLRKIMPDDVALKFSEKFPMDYAEFLHNVYQNENVRMFLAGFAPFLIENQEYEYCRSVVFSAFSEFLERNISRYPGYASKPISFVGSIAFYFRNLLEEIIRKHNLTPGVIIKDPLENLRLYHETSM